MSSTDPPDWVTANKGKSQAAFDRGKAAQEPLDKPRPPPAKPPAEKGLMDKRQNLRPALTPSGKMRTPSEARVYNQDLATDKTAEDRKVQRALDKNKGAKIRKDWQKAVELNRDKDKDDRER